MEPRYSNAYPLNDSNLALVDLSYIYARDFLLLAVFDFTRI